MDRERPLGRWSRQSKRCIRIQDIGIIIMPRKRRSLPEFLNRTRSACREESVGDYTSIEQADLLDQKSLLDFGKFALGERQKSAVAAPAHFRIAQRNRFNSLVLHATSIPALSRRRPMPNRAPFQGICLKKVRVLQPRGAEFSPCQERIEHDNPRETLACASRIFFHLAC